MEKRIPMENHPPVRDDLFLLIALLLAISVITTVTANLLVGY